MSNRRDRWTHIRVTKETKASLEWLRLNWQQLEGAAWSQLEQDHRNELPSLDSIIALLISRDQQSRERNKRAAEKRKKKGQTHLGNGADQAS